MNDTKADVVIVGAGHNGLVAACLLAKAGRQVVVLEAQDGVGGAAVSKAVFPGVDARLSKYAYLVSLFPRELIAELGIAVPLAPRHVSSYTPDPLDPSRGLLVPVDDPARLDEQMRRLTGSTAEADRWRAFYGRTQALARRIVPTLLEPLRSEAEFRALVGEDDWRDFFARPIGEVIERSFTSDLVRGVVLTDALIGTFASAFDPSLRQNICFLYHVIGNGTGDWDVPVGGMGAVTGALADRARTLGVDIRCSTPVTGIDATDAGAIVRAETSSFTCDHVLVNAAPAVLDGLLGRPTPAIPAADAGAQLKVNMLLARLPRLRDATVDPRDAFAGTFHINETFDQLERAYGEAVAGMLPSPLPAEIYCHTLADPSILSPALQASGAQTLTLFGLHVPHALAEADPEGFRRQGRTAALASLDSVLAESVEDCLLLDANGEPCIEVNTTVDIERSLGIPTGNIFHTPLGWPFASEEGAGTWGTATDLPRVHLCGSGAARGGAVSGIPGFAAASGLG